MDDRLPQRCHHIVAGLRHTTLTHACGTIRIRLASPAAPSRECVCERRWPPARGSSCVVLGACPQVDTYRIESSCGGGHDCLSFWHDYDRSWQAVRHPHVARNGSSEIGHVNGLLTLFHTLRRRHPWLVVDVCAGGGRRVDIDIMSTSIQKWQSDFASPANQTTRAYCPRLPSAHFDCVQGHVMGESHFQPLAATGHCSPGVYAWRSGMSTVRLPVPPIPHHDARHWTHSSDASHPRCLTPGCRAV